MGFPSKIGFRFQIARICIKKNPASEGFEPNGGFNSNSGNGKKLILSSCHPFVNNLLIFFKDRISRVDTHFSLVVVIFNVTNLFISSFGEARRESVWRKDAGCLILDA